MVRAFVALCAHITPPPGHGNIHLQLGAFLQGGNDQLGVEDLHGRIRGNVPSQEGARPLGFHPDGDGIFAVQLDKELLQVQYDIYCVFHHSFDGGKFMQNAIYVDRSDSGARKRREQNSTQGVAQSQAVPAFQRLYDKFAVAIRQLYFLNSWLFDFNHSSCTLLYDRTPGAKRLHPASFRRTATVIRNGSYVLDRSHFKSCRLKRADGSFPSRTRSFNVYAHFAHSMLHGGGCCLLGSQASREGSTLARTLEACIPSAGPGDHIPLEIADGDNGIVKRGTDMSYAHRNVLPLPAARPLASTWSCHVAFLLSFQPISSCREYAWDPCASWRWSWSAVPAQAGPGGDAARGSSRCPAAV